MARTPNIDLREDYQRNYVINGNFDFWQRGVSSSTDGYLADRFIYVGSPDGGTAAAYTVSRQDLALSDEPVQEFGESKHYWRITNTTQGSSLGVNSSHSLTTKPEGVGTLAGKTITVSFWARSSIGSKEIMLKPARRFGSGGSANDNTEIPGKRFTLTNTWQKYTTTFQMPTVSGKTVGTASHIRFEWLFQVGSTLASTYDGGAAISWQGTGTIDFASVQVIEGAEVLPFRRAGRSIGEETSLCQRYYEKNTGWHWRNDDDTTGTSAVAVNVPFKVTKRASPTIAYANTALANTASLTNGGSTVEKFSLEFNLNGGFSNGGSLQRVVTDWSADAEL